MFYFVRALCVVRPFKRYRKFNKMNDSQYIELSKIIIPEMNKYGYPYKLNKDLNFLYEFIRYIGYFFFKIIEKVTRVYFKYLKIN